MANLTNTGYQKTSTDRVRQELDQLIEEATKRWLKPSEVCQILNNNHKLQLSESPPNKPRSGLLFLFNRNKLRYFRKDGHNWRKKKDGKTVREAHEKLKDGNKDVVHCYYAHGEDNPNFQRRSYWLLEEGRDHIVLVHYREVNEVQTTNHVLPTTRLQLDSSPYQENNDYVSQNISSSMSDSVSESYSSYDDAREVNGLRVDDDSRTGQCTSYGSPSYGSPSVLPQTKEEFRKSDSISLTIAADSGYGLSIKIGNTSPHNSNASGTTPMDVSPGDVPAAAYQEDRNHLGPKNVRFAETLGRLNTITNDTPSNQVTSMPQMIVQPTKQLFPAIPPLIPSPLFTIVDFAPEWSYAFEETKVIVTGVYVESAKNTNRRWSCVFGKIDVPAEVLETGALRCKAPAHEPGDVPFYIACDGIICSNIVDFRYKSPLPECDKEKKEKKHREQELRHQIRLSELLVSRDDEFYLKETSEDPELARRFVVDKSSWKDIKNMVSAGKHPYTDPMLSLIHTLLESKLKQLIRDKNRDEVSILNKQVLHVAAALGYDWAVHPILATGIGVNFRDAHGWTALHWAAYCGREKVIGALLAADASPGALTDPTPTKPNGQTAADLAAESGHDGIAGYLAEASLTSHLTSISIRDHKMSKVVGIMGGIKAVEVFSEKMSVCPNNEISDDDPPLRDSLGAIKNAAQAAARIQAAFRAYSFHKREEKDTSRVISEFGILEDEAIAFAAAQSNQNDKLNLAATQIQCKYRGWKGRKEFISLRNQVVKIQAHVRGHQTRKKYRPQILWGVGILEKAILRWRRRGPGLRGFKAEDHGNDDSDDESYLKDLRQKKEEAFTVALNRVKKLMENPDARNQYRRMLEIYQKEKASLMEYQRLTGCSE